MPVKPKIGDNVRFLNSVGGGRVIRINDKIAYVEDADGFEVPALLSECVVVDPATSMGFTGRPQVRTSKPDATIPSDKEKETSTIKKSEPEIPAFETDYGDVVNLVLGFEPTNIKALSSSEFEAYIVNDSNYRALLSITSRESDSDKCRLLYAGAIDPNIEEHVFTLSWEEIPYIDKIAVQAVFVKDKKDFILPEPANVELKIDNKKFAKLHSFTVGTYFESPTLSFEIVKNGNPRESEMKINSEEIVKAMTEPRRPRVQLQSGRPVRNQKKSGEEDKNAPIVVDLHAAELFTSTRGLSNADILNRQIDRFSEVMDENLKNFGKKIIFIHGKGEGVLRNALIKELNHRYKGHDVQDASFREYGFGATQVTIRPMAALNSRDK